MTNPLIRIELWLSKVSFCVNEVMLFNTMYTSSTLSDEVRIELSALSCA